jgi:hypothetical protein
MTEYVLPRKVPIYLRRIAAEYRNVENFIAANVVSSSKFFIRENSNYDNWNGGMSGHDVVFFLQPEVFGEITLARKPEFEQDILEKLRLCSTAVDQEFFGSVQFGDEDESDEEFQQSMVLDPIAPTDHRKLAFWKPDHIRLFISHRDTHKFAANSLATELEQYGISAFVAHDTIEPMTTWQNEILRGLETMEAMLAFVTQDFHESIWVNQEIGFALGRKVPIVALKLEFADPAGFIGTQQALRGTLDNPAQSAVEIYNLLAEKLGEKARLQTAMIASFLSSPKFTEAKLRFIRMNEVVQKITEIELAAIIAGYQKNSQLHNVPYLKNSSRLCSFLNRTTGKYFLIEGRVITNIDI